MGRIAPPSRIRSLAVYARAIVRRPALAADLPWPCALLLVTLGRDARRRAHTAPARQRPHRRLASARGLGVTRQFLRQFGKQELRQRQARPDQTVKSGRALEPFDDRQRIRQ